MAVILPEYKLRVPSETTWLRDLGKELREMGTSIEAILKSFDYNGADPNLVLSRVAALEAWRTTATAKLQLLETSTQSHVQTNTTNAVKRLTTQHGIGRIPGAASPTVSKAIGFPMPFKSMPIVTANYIGARQSGEFNPTGLVDFAPALTSKPLAPSLTGFNMLCRRTDGNNLNAAWDFYFMWSAAGEIV